MRRLAAVLVLGLLAVACGSDDSDDSGDEVLADEVAVRVAFDEPLRVGPVTWTVTVVNGTDEPVELEFATGQRADVTLTRAGEEVYRWSRELAFTQELGTLTLPADGGTENFVLEEPGLDVDAGEYTLTATITASNEELTTEEQVTIEPMRG